MSDACTKQVYSQLLVEDTRFVIALAMELETMELETMELETMDFRPRKIRHLQVLLSWLNLVFHYFIRLCLILMRMLS